jgi:hypothetical protein
MGQGFGLVLDAFTRAAGPELAKVAMPVSMRGETLTLRCASASWVQAIRFQEAELIAALRRELPDVTIQRIRTITGTVPAQVAAQRTGPPPALPLAPLAPADAVRLEALAAQISNPELAARVLAAAQACARRGASS